MADQQRLPIQPVERPILSSPYEEPPAHWVYNQQTGEAGLLEGRRPASYFYRIAGVMDHQLRLFAEEQREDLPLVNALREDVRRWRRLGYEGATQVTKELLAHWWREDRPRRLFFCQLEAAETIIFLNEVRQSGKYVRFNVQATDEKLEALRDLPANGAFPPLTRMGVKMATGSGKTVVMAMLTAWAFCNRGRVYSDERFPDAVLAVCPNLTIKERLQVLRPDHPDNYYEKFDLVPLKLRPLLQSGKVFVTNWHLFMPESEHMEGGKSYAVVNKGPEGPEAFSRRVLGDLYDRAARGGLMVLNDEAHHAWRPAPLFTGAEVDTSELEEATIWVNGLDTLNKAVSIRFCVDMSATPFYIHGSGYVEGSPYPWLVSDFGLVDAIESGIVKIPRLPVSDTTGRPEPKYFNLWREITRNLQPGEKLRNGKPKPEVVYREAHGALQTLASQWKERYELFQQAAVGEERIPPVLIIVCDNTDIAEVFYRNISGEREEEFEVEGGRGKKKTETRTVYGDGSVFPSYFSNREDFKPTIRIDTKMLEKAESGDPAMSRQDAAEQLRQIVATVGQPGGPGEHVRCVISVAMLNEGWDANNVTHILGLRAFGSQLLCEQVVGRGLRRMDYTPDPETGRLTEEYVDIYGVPFSLIPFKGRKAGQPTTEQDRPKNHVKALPERKELEIKFPIVEGYAFALKRNLITADIAAMERMRLQPEHEPTSVFVKPRVGYQIGAPTMAGPGKFEMQDRQAFYESTHLQTLEYEITRQVIDGLVGDGDYAGHDQANPALRRQSRHQLFPQVLRLVRAYIREKVDFVNVDPRELGLERYLMRVVERMLAAIRPDDEQGEPPLMPILNRYEPIGSTADVDFKTTRTCHSTVNSHINQMPMDTATWESSAAFYLEQAALMGRVRSYARNDGLHFTIPYEYYGISHVYEPDFLVKLIVDPEDKTQDITLVLEIKGFETDQDLAKHQAAKRWVSAVNNWGRQGRWHFHVCRDPQLLGRELSVILSKLTKQQVEAPVPAGQVLAKIDSEAPAEPAAVAVAEEPVIQRELPKEWLESIDLAPECEPFLLRCFQAALPLPEVGYETRDRQRRQAELAWETLNVAVFLPDYAQDKPQFEAAGWHTFMLSEAGAAFAKLQEVYHA